MESRLLITGYFFMCLNIIQCVAYNLTAKVCCSVYALPFIELFFPFGKEDVMRKERALQRHSTSTSAVFNSLPKGVAQRLLRFALTKLLNEEVWGTIDTNSKWFHIDGEIAINGVKYKLIGASANDRWESLSLYFIARGRKIRISDHWCRPEGRKSWNRGTARNAKNMGVCRSIGYSYAGLVGSDESFVVTDKETRFGPYRSESWTLGSRVFEGGWVALRDIEVY